MDCNRSTLYGDSVLAFQAQDLQNHLKQCTEARKAKEWSLILKETQSALSLGCDYAPQVSSLLKYFRNFSCNSKEVRK